MTRFSLSRRCATLSICLATAALFPRPAIAQVRPPDPTEILVTPDGSSLLTARMGHFGILDVGARNEAQEASKLPALIAWESFEEAKEHQVAIADEYVARFHHAAHLTVSPNGKQLALAAGAGIVQVWDLANRAKLHELDLGRAYVRGIAWSEDMTTLAVATENAVDVWDLSQTPQRIAQLQQARAPLAFRKGRQLLLAGDAEESSRLVAWEIPTGKGVSEYSWEHDACQKLSSRGNLAATGLGVYSLAEERPRLIYEFPRDQQPLGFGVEFSFSADETLFAYISAASTTNAARDVRVVDVESGRSQSAIEIALGEHPGREADLIKAAVPMACGADGTSRRVYWTALPQIFLPEAMVFGAQLPQADESQ